MKSNFHIVSSKINYKSLGLSSFKPRKKGECLKSNKYFKTKPKAECVVKIFGFGRPPGLPIRSSKRINDLRYQFSFVMLSKIFSWHTALKLKFCSLLYVSMVSTNVFYTFWQRCLHVLLKIHSDTLLALFHCIKPVFLHKQPLLQDCYKP